MYLDSFLSIHVFTVALSVIAFWMPFRRFSESDFIKGARPCKILVHFVFFYERLVKIPNTQIELMELDNAGRTKLTIP